MKAWRRVWVTGLLGVWMGVCAAQDVEEEAGAAAEGNSAGAQARREAEDQRQGGDARASREAGDAGAPSPAGAVAGSGAAERAEAMADAGVTDVGQTVAGSDDGVAVFPEIEPLDELFIPSVDIRADEPWDNMPVDF